jgi:predicted dehydrogenase
MALHSRFAIGGAGVIPPPHAAIIRDLPNARLAAVCDVSTERGNRLAQAFGVPQVYCSATDMLERARPDVVHVLLPPAQHAPEAVRCLESGAHVLVEKPMAVSLAECEELRRVAMGKQRAVGVNHSMLYRPVVQRLIRAIQSNRLGRLAHVNAGLGLTAEKVRNAASGRFFLQAPQNALLEWAVHPLSIIRRLLGRLEHVRAVAGREQRTTGGMPYPSSWQASMRCERGTAQLVISVGAGYDCCWMDALGEDALARVDIQQDSLIVSEYLPGRPSVAGFRNAWSGAGSLVSSAARTVKDDVLAVFGRQTHAGPADRGMRDSIRAFYAALDRGEPPPEGLEQGTATVEYCERLWQSALADGCQA